MLKKIRIALAAVVFTLTCLLFADFTGVLRLWLHWITDLQFLPAILAGNVALAVITLVLTIVFGRIYCSIICPMGVYQDVVSHIAARRRKYRFAFTRSKWVLRSVVLVAFVALIVCGLMPLASLIAPYSAFGRMAEAFLSPLYRLGNNALALVAEHFDSYAFYTTDVWVKAGATLAVAALTFIVISVLAWRGGRTYCNTICPVGTILGLLSRRSLFGIRINNDKCTGCRLCERNCKSQCIDAKNHVIDHSRCVACMDCIGTCRTGAINFALKTPAAVKADTNKPTDDKPDTARRAFLSAGIMLAAARVAKAEEKTVDGGLAIIEDKVAPKRETRLVPAGAKSLKHFAQHCTSCQLCVSECPNGVLRPSGDLMSLMQPTMSYERGFCRPECTACAEVCPTDAISLVDVAQKASTQIGHAVWVKKNCVVLTDDVECGNCARKCPSNAIIMVPSDPSNPESRKVPTVNEERCIGCGACEHLCPARPFSAIYVEGHEVHRTI